MKDTVRCMLESEFDMPLSMEDTNLTLLQTIDPISESVRELTGFTPEKAVVLATTDNHYYIEFAGNIERLMKDQQLSFNEAVEEICLSNKICLEDVSIIVDESCVDKICLEDLILKDHDYSICRK